MYKFSLVFLSPEIIITVSWTWSNQVINQSAVCAVRANELTVCVIMVLTVDAAVCAMRASELTMGAGVLQVAQEVALPDDDEDI